MGRESDESDLSDLSDESAGWMGGCYPVVGGIKKDWRGRGDLASRYFSGRMVDRGVNPLSPSSGESIQLVRTFDSERYEAVNSRNLTVCIREGYSYLDSESVAREKSCTRSVVNCTVSD